MRDFILSEDGASMVEYSMIVGLIGLVAIVVLHWLALRLKYVMFRIFWQYLWW